MARKSGSSGEKTARDLRQAAVCLFSRRGYAAVSMRQIAAEVGVQAGALYLYTSDKQSLLYDLMHQHMQDLLAAWQASEGGSADIGERLDGFIRFHIRFHLQRADEVFISYMELRNLNVENFERIGALRRSYEDILEAILVAGSNSGDFNIPDTKLATLAIIAMLTGMNTWYREGGRLSIDRIEEIYLDMVHSAVGLR